MPSEEEAVVEQEFEVEDILRYRRSDDGEEYFLVKWIGFPASEATWEPFQHMNDNCRELVAKARALYAWRRPPAASAEPEADVEMREEAVDSPSPAAAAGAAAAGPQVVVGREAVASAGPGRPAAREEHLTIEEAASSPTEASASPERPVEVVPKRRADPRLPPPVPTKRPRLQAPQAPEAAPAEQRGGQWEQAAPSQSKRAAAQLPAGPSVAANSLGRHAAPATAPATPAVVVVPVTTPPATPPPARAGDHKPPSREIKCTCGVAEKIPSNSKGNLVVCRVCNFSLHRLCVENLIGGPVPPDFACPPCRLERVDEFHPPIGAGLLKHSIASCSSNIQLSFNAQAAQWRKQLWAVHLRAVHLASAELSGPAWPHKVQGKLNGKQCVAIDPPKHLHVRREQCYNLTPLLRQGLNTLDLKFTPRPDRPRDQPPENYSVGVVLTRPRSVTSIISRIKSRSTETIDSGRLRVQRLLAEVAKHEAREEECKVTGTFGRTLCPMCPVSHCPIEEAAIGRGCNHVQVFDVQAYIAVNQRMRSLDKRWTCPVCSLSLRPDDIVLDPFAQDILDRLRGNEEVVEAVVFNEDCSWSTVSAVKDEKERLGGDEEAQREGTQGAELIDLSDSE